MKKVLLGTTALVAAGVLGAETAQAAFDVTVRGNYTAIYGFVKEDDGPGEQGFRRQNQALNQDAEAHVRFQQTFDNGITVGGRIEIEGATHVPGTPSVLSGSAGSDQIDEKWGFIRGGFGEFRFGDEDDARKLLATYAPFATVVFLVNSPAFTFNNNQAPLGHAIATNSTAPFIENDSAKIIYFTPVMQGFQLAASYAPDETQDRSQAGTGGTDEAQWSNAISLAGSYTGEVAGAKVRGSVGVSRAYSEMSIYDDPTVWHAGLTVGFGAIKVGGGFAMGDDLTPGTRHWNFVNATEAMTFELGGSYTMGATTVALNWSHGEYEQIDNNTDSLDHMMLSVAQALGEGVQAGGFIGRFDYDDAGILNNDNSGWQGGVGINMDF
jgi:outer membrane protein OmpU